MSVENFFSYPTDKLFLKGLERERNEVGKKLSPIDVLARRIASEGKSALASFASENTSPNGIVYFDSNFLIKMNEKVAADITGIYLASSLISLGETMVEGVFDLGTHIEKTNWYLSPIPLIMHPANKKQAEEIPYRKLRDMWVLAKKDPTLASFFLTDQELLPDMLRDFLTRSKAISNIPEIINFYKEKGQSVLENIGSKDAVDLQRNEVFTDHQRMVLRVGDMDIARIQKVIDKRKLL